MVGPRGPGLCHFPAGPLWASSHLQCLRRRAFEVSFSDCDFRSTHHTTTVPGVCCGSPWHRLSALSGGAAGPPGKSGVSESTGAGLRWEEMRGPRRPGGGGGSTTPCCPRCHQGQASCQLSGGTEDLPFACCGSRDWGPCQDALGSKVRGGRGLRACVSHHHPL